MSLTEASLFVGGSSRAPLRAVRAAEWLIEHDALAEVRRSQRAEQAVYERRQLPQRVMSELRESHALELKQAAVERRAAEASSAAAEG